MLNAIATHTHTHSHNLVNWMEAKMFLRSRIHTKTKNQTYSSFNVHLIINPVLGNNKYRT